MNGSTDMILGIMAFSTTHGTTKRDTMNRGAVSPSSAPLNTALHLHHISQARATTSSKILHVDDLEVQLIRKPIKRMYLRVKPPSGQIEVTAPARVPQRDIVALVRERKDWIDRARQYVISESNQHPWQEWTPERTAQAHDILNQRIPPLLRYWVPIIGQSPTALTLRRMKTRWGSCTPATGRIRINLELAFLPEQYLEYVLVHELTHLWERGHGAGFQRRMTQYLPRWKRLRSELNQIVLS